MILFQDLLLNDPADKVPLRAVMDYYKHPVPKCKLSDNLDVMFDKFRKGDSHMAFVYDDAADLSNDEGVAHQEAVGILTLENIIEALVQSEIMDEADNKRAKRRRSMRRTCIICWLLKLVSLT
jgi:metal transporter CNNM